MTNKLHISLVGGQTAPVYQGIVYANPDKVILIHSADTIEQAERIKAEITYKVELVQISPVELSAIYAKIDYIANEISEDTILTINISSGTKPWSIALYKEFAKRINTTIFYIDQNAVLWDFKTSKTCSVKFEMDAQFRLYGNPLTYFTDYNSFTEQDFKMVQKIKELRNSSFRDFKVLTSLFEYKSHLTKHALDSGSWLEWKKEDKSFLLYLKYKDKSKQVVLKSPNIRQLLLNSGWFELEVASLLSKWKGIRDLRLNCIFPSKNKSPKNEIDIIADLGTRLLFVECKTKLTKETDLDKFASAVRNFGGMASSSLLVTQVALSDKAIEKCKDNGIMYFSLDSASEQFPAEKMLFSLLESQLLNINPR